MNHFIVVIYLSFQQGFGFSNLIGCVYIYRLAAENVNQTLWHVEMRGEITPRRHKVGGLNFESSTDRRAGLDQWKDVKALPWQPDLGISSHERLDFLCVSHLTTVQATNLRYILHSNLKYGNVSMVTANSLVAYQQLIISRLYQSVRI